MANYKSSNLIVKKTSQIFNDYQYFIDIL